MQINPYLSFTGECEIAFVSYAQCLGGQVGAIVRYGESPMVDRVPAGWSEKSCTAPSYPGVSYGVCPQYA
jgi:PhnB protein